MNKPSSIQTILITGCSSGFGLLMAARLASKGHQVIATMRNLDKKDDLCNEVNRRGGIINILPLDVINPNSVKEVILKITKKFGFIDVLINNAGYGIGGFFEDLTDEEIRQQMETNFFGAQNVTRAVIPFMRQRQRGRIINISSVAGFSTSPAFGAYNTSKWALEAFSESLHYELKLFGIDVLLIQPGTYKTEIFYKNSRYAKNFDNPDSPYFTVSQKLKKRTMDYVSKCKKDPEKIAILAEKLINAKNPPFRNIPDIEGRILYFLRKFLPFRVYRWIIRTALGLKIQNSVTVTKKGQT